ncbi:hypothetical protein JTB14_000164 [Gonioctena quinquepunctata]|nr:hypothetical protein JTB14_000164 [Gonioctena quinquepunctata]
MAGSITAPEGFNFADPDSWPQWKKRFIRYVTVPGFGSKKDPEKIDLLLYLMGGKADETLLTLETVPTAYTEMLELFDKHFVPKKNEVFERYKFNSRVQNPGEGIDSFIAALHTLAEHCDYGTLKDQLIRDRILVGMLDSETSSRLQLKKGLTLATTIDTVKQVELQAARNIVLRQEGRLNRVQFKSQDRAQSHQQVRSSGRKAPRQNMQQAQGAVRSAESIWCGNCGLKRHPQSECPARNLGCNKCQRKGHWARKCRQENKAVRTIEDVGVENGSEPYEDQLFVGSFQKTFRTMSVPRSVPIPLREKLKAELDRLIALNIIEPVDYPTQWVSPIVVVGKAASGGKSMGVRLCVDYTKLNNSVERSHYPMSKDILKVGCYVRVLPNKAR